MNGKVPSALFRILAVVSALGLGSGYVAYKNAEAEKAEQKRERVERDKANAAKQEEADEAILIGGSKSIGMPVFSKRKTNEEVDSMMKLLDGSGESEAKREESLLPSSKIGIIRLPEVQTEDEEEDPPRLLPGSKSFNFLLDNPELKKSE